MKDSVYTLSYALGLAVLCAVLLTAVGLATQDRQRANEEAEEVRNILLVLGIAYPEGARPEELLEIYERKVAEEKIGDLRTYVYRENERTLAVAVPVSGPGLWGPIEGFLALEPDLKTVRGVAFHRQEETPGLGGEIASDEFRRRFEGKQVAANAGPPLRITMPGQATGPNEIDGITGATMTCDKVETMLNNVLRQLAREAQLHG